MVYLKEIYDLLLEYSNINIFIKEILIGLIWILCEIEGIGLCMSLGIVICILFWLGILVNKFVKELVFWLCFWNIFEVIVGMVVINVEINGRFF